MADIPLRHMEALAVDVATFAGLYIADQRPAHVSAAGTKSSDTDVVTAMDMAVESMIRGRLGEARPQDGLLGEEGAEQAGSSGVSWVVDPIDGTVNYLYGLPLYAVSVAAVVGRPADGTWQPVAGAVCAPGHGVVWSAHRGGGARVRDLPRMPGERILGRPRSVAVSAQAELPQALVGTGFSYVPDVRAEQAEVLRRVLPCVRDIRRLGSAATDLCLVADGRLDGYFERCLNPWDLAAGWLLVTEAGGRVTGAQGSAPDADLVVAANPALHGKLLELLTGG